MSNEKRDSEGRYTFSAGKGAKTNNSASLKLGSPSVIAEGPHQVSTEEYSRMFDAMKDRVRVVPVVAYPVHATNVPSKALTQSLKDLGADINFDGVKVIPVRGKVAMWSRTAEPFVPRAARSDNTPA
jgi:hypothetical protein